MNIFLKKLDFVKGKIPPFFKKKSYARYRIFELLGFSALTVSFLVVVLTLFLSFSGVRALYVVSDSMTPTFSKGDLVLMTKDYNGLAKGDIIGYDAKWDNDKTVTHRIIQIDGNSITVKGDNNQYADPPFDKSLVRGEIIGIAPELGNLFNPKAIWALSILGIIFIFSSEFFSPDSKHEAKRHSHKKEES